MKLIDGEYTEHPTKGVIQMCDFIRSKGYNVGRRRIRRLMRLMNIRPIYPLKSLSHLGDIKFKMPYLLRNREIMHRNEVWSTDITYIPMEHGFMYLFAIIDVYSRYIVSWGLYNTLDAENAVEVLEKGIRLHGASEIINSDQGSQYTSKLWIEACEKHNISISMDGRRRCLDNVWIERFWRTLKREYIYLNPEDNVIALRNGIKKYIEYYNNSRFHQGIGHKTPKMLYLAAA